MSSIKKVIAVLFAVIAVMLMQTAIFAETTKYDMYVCGTRVTNDNANDILENGVFSYDPASNTLYIKGDYKYVSSNHYSSVINNKIDGLTINIVSDSAIKFDGSYFLEFIEDTTVTGSGNLSLISLSPAYTSCGFGFSAGNAELTIKDINIDMPNLTYAMERCSYYDYEHSVKIINSQIALEEGKLFLHGIDTLEFINCAVTIPTDAVIDSANIYTYENGELTPAGAVVIMPKNDYHIVSASTAYNLKVSGVDVWRGNANDILRDGHARYDPVENVLYIYGDVGSISNSIKDLTINIVKDCSIKLNTNTGIYCFENTNITGDGTLLLDGTESEYSWGIAYDKTLNIENADIIINTGKGIISNWQDQGKLIVTNSNVGITAFNGPAIDLNNGDIEFSGCDITTPASAVIKNSTIYESDGSTVAQNIIIEPYCTISFDSGIGSGSMDDVIIGKGKPYTLPKNGFTAPSGYYFKNWLINGTEYEPGEVIAPEKNITLKADWMPYCVISFVTGVPLSMDPVTVKQGESYTLPAYTLGAYPSGASFDGWLIDGVKYKVGDTVTVTEDTTVTAKWLRYFTIYYRPNNTASSKQYYQIGNFEADTEHTLISYAATGFTAPSGMIFDHWRIGGESYYPGDKVTITKATYIYAEYVYSGSAGENCIWTFDLATGTLTVSGSGSMTSYSDPANTPWNDIKDLIKTVIIEDGVTTVGKNTFYGCDNLEKVDIAGSVKTIGGYAFKNCPRLKKVKLSEGLDKIYGDAFLNSPIPYITIPQSVTSIIVPFGTRDADFVICGYAGSEAHNFAKDSGYTFIRLGNVNNDAEHIIDEADAALLLKYLSGSATLEFKQTIAAKVTDSIKDAPDMLDVIAILNKTA